MVASCVHVLDMAVTSHVHDSCHLSIHINSSCALYTKYLIEYLINEWEYSVDLI